MIEYFSCTTVLFLFHANMSGQNKVCQSSPFYFGLFNMLNIIIVPVFCFTQIFDSNCVLPPVLVLSLPLFSLFSPIPPFPIFPFSVLFYFPSSPCCSLLDLLCGFESQSVNLSVSFFSFLIFPLLCFFKDPSASFCVSLTLYFLPRGSSWELQQLQRSLVCVYVYLCASLYVPPCIVGVLCEVNGLQDPLGSISNVLTGSRVMTKTACLSLTERGGERGRTCLTKLNNSAEVTHLIERLSFTQSTGSSLKNVL